MIGDDKEIASALRATLADKLGAERFALWFESPECVTVRDGVLVVSARSQFSLDRLRRRFRTELESACRDVLGSLPDIQFCIDLSKISVTSEDDKREEHHKSQPSPFRTPQTKGDQTNSVRSHGRQAERTTRARRFSSLASFVVGDGNRVAHTAATTSAVRIGAVTPLFIYGSTGCGKTHLLEGIWTAVHHQLRRQRMVMLSAEQFTSFFLEALRGSGLPSFRRRYRDLDVLLIDDVQFFAGKRATLVELQHTIDTLLREGRQLVLAADRTPAELASLGPELMTRMCGGLVCGIEPPDKATRLGIAQQICAQRGYSFTPDVIDLVATEVSGDARLLSGALNRLHATSQALEETVTPSLAETALADIIRSVRPAVRIADIERAVCDVFGLDPQVLQSSRKSLTISQPRMLAMWLARRYTRAAYFEIGQYFGRRSHSTVISAQKKVHSWMSSGKALQLARSQCNIDDVIRQVEARLRSG